MDPFGPIITDMRMVFHKNLRKTLLCFKMNGSKNRVMIRRRNILGKIPDDFTLAKASTCAGIDVIDGLAMGFGGIIMKGEQVFFRRRKERITTHSLICQFVENRAAGGIVKIPHDNEGNRLPAPFFLGFLCNEAQPLSTRIGRNMIQMRIEYV